MKDYVVTVSERSEAGGVIAFILILALILGSCGDSRSSGSTSTSETSAEYTEAEYDYDYDDEYASDESSYYEPDEGYSYDSNYYETPEFSDLCFYQGDDFLSLCHTSSLEDCFGTEHNDVLYNSFSYLYANYDGSEAFSYRYRLGGEYNTLSFNVFTTSGDVENHGCIYVYASYGDSPEVEELIYSCDVYGGSLPEEVCLDVSGVTFININITTFDCKNHSNTCHVCAGDFALFY